MTMHDELRALLDEMNQNGSDEDCKYDPIARCNSAWAEQLDAILARYADHVVVPVEPTEAILMAGWRDSNVYSPTAYRAMIQAAKAELAARTMISR